MFIPHPNIYLYNQKWITSIWWVFLLSVGEVLSTVNLLFRLWLLPFFPFTALIFSLFSFLNTCKTQVIILLFFNSNYMIFLQDPNLLMQLDRILPLGIGQNPSTILPEGPVSFLVSLLRMSLLIKPLLYSFKNLPLRKTNAIPLTTIIYIIFFNNKEVSFLQVVTRDFPLSSNFFMWMFPYCLKFSLLFCLSHLLIVFWATRLSFLEPEIIFCFFYHI